MIESLNELNKFKGSMKESTTIKIYTYIDKGLQIIAIPKCGTRYLDETKYDEYNETFRSKLHTFLNDNLKTYFVSRDPIEHFKSALLTETISRFNKEGDSIWQNLLNIPFGHWHKELYKELYTEYLIRNWDINFIDLHDLNEFMKKNDLYIPFKKENYDFGVSNAKIKKVGDLLGNNYKYNEVKEPTFTKENVVQKLMEIDPKKYFELERKAVDERYYLYMLKNKRKV